MNVGDYVRTNYGISKCIKVIPIKKNSFMYEYDKEVYEDVNYLTASELEKYKSSPNIIDLIEVGDVIRFIYDGVEYICNVEEELTINLEDDMIYIKETTDKFKLISIVTHEQFSQIEYKVGE